MMSHKREDIDTFHQWDIEVYGKANLESEAEIIELTSTTYLIHYY